MQQVTYPVTGAVAGSIRAFSLELPSNLFFVPGRVRVSVVMNFRVFNDWKLLYSVL